SNVIAEYFEEEFARPIGDLMWSLKTGCAENETKSTRQVGYFVERAKGVANHSKSVNSGDSRGLIALLDCYRRTNNSRMPLIPIAIFGREPTYLYKVSHPMERLHGSKTSAVRWV